MKLHLFTVLASMLACVTILTEGACPAGIEAVLQLQSCLSKFNKLMDFSKGPITATQINNYCGSDSPNSEIQCAEAIIDDCRRTSLTTSRVIDKAININAIRGSVKVLCNNTHIFIDKQDCIGRYQTSVGSCIVNEYLAYNSKIQSLSAEAYLMGAEWLEEKIYKELCDYVAKIATCQRPYGQNCGDEIGDVFDALTNAAKPPVCTAEPNDASHASTPPVRARPPVALTHAVTPPPDALTHAASILERAGAPNALLYTSTPPGGAGVSGHANLMLLISLAFVTVLKGQL